MSKLEFSSSVATATKGAETIVYLASEANLKAGWLANVADTRWLPLLERAASETKAGTSGKAVQAQVPGTGPKRLVLGVLPDERSRHNCAARSEEAAVLVAGAGLTSDARVAVVACLDEPDHALPLANAAGRALPLYSRSTGDAPDTRMRFTATDADGIRVPVKKMDQHIVQAARWAAELVDMPPAELTTTAFVKRVRQAARGVPSLTVSVIKGDELLRRGLGGLHAVGRTAMEPPYLLVMEHKQPKSKRRYAVVGKGVIYDTGGLSLKVGGHMAGMKCDMGGAAAAAGAALALARGGFKHNVSCVLGLVENAIGPDAYRPDDILTMHSGKTVEINNTDAEGRLVLADAASFIARSRKLTALVDMATLTGAQLIATGQRHAAVVSNRGGLEAAAVEAGRTSGDLAAPLPFAPEFYQSNFSSTVADMRNSVKDRMDAQSSCAAQFIYAHIADLDVPWLHVDLAGPAFRKDRATGYGVALVAQLLRDLKPTTLTS